LTSGAPSVVVRAKNEQKRIEHALIGLREQTVETEIILVDSGSTDHTIEIARAYCDKILTIAAQEFSYGRALNMGARHASGDVVFALSAHCVPPGPRWVEWSLAAYTDDDVVATIGATNDPSGVALSGPTRFRLPLPALKANPTWGFSNHASSWRRLTWESFPFDEGLVACEDKEWMWRVLAAGFSMMADPRLVVGAQHRRERGARALYHRVHREHLVLAELLDYQRVTGAQMVRKWWTEFPYPGAHSPWLRRLSPWRCAELLGELTGDWAGARRRGAHTLSTSSWEGGPGIGPLTSRPADE